MIVLLSSSASPRYADDIIRILALPRGGQMQFRYSSSWVAEEVRARVPRGELGDAYALVCFVASDKAPVPFELVPVRFVRIIRAEQVGSSYILTLAADAFVTGVTDAALRASMTVADQARLPSGAKAPDELYCLSSEFASRPCRAFGYSVFEATAAALAEQPTFATEQSAFFSVRRVSRVTGRSWFGTWPNPSTIDCGAYSLKTGGRYECEVYCLRLFQHPKDAEGNRQQLKELALVAEANDSSVQFASSRRSVIDSRYDIKRYVFAAEPEVLRRVSGIRLFLSANGDAEGLARQDVPLEMVFGGSIAMAAFKTTAIGVATAGPAMIAANAAGKLNPGVAIVMIALGALAGIASILPAFRKP